MAVTIFGDYGLTTPTSSFTDSNGNLLIGTGSTPGSVGNSLTYSVQGFTAINSGGTLPYFQTYTGTAGTNLKTWRHGGDASGNYIWQTVNDAYSSSAERLRVDPNGYMYSTPNSAGLGLVPGMMTYILNAPLGLNGAVTTTQSVLGVSTPTLQPGRYRFRFFWAFSKNTGIGQFSFGLGGTATFTYGSFHAIARLGATFTSASTPNDVYLTTTTPATPVVISNPTVAVSNNNAIVDGYFDVSVAGTVFAGVGWTIAPGTAVANSYQTQRGSYMEVWPVASDATISTNIGGWA